MPELQLSTPVSPNSVRPTKSQRRLRHWMLAVAILAASLAGVFYWRPWWVIDESTRACLRLEGVRSEYVQLGSFRMHYLVGGQGKPLVLVHGLGAMAESWAELMTALMPHGYRIYAVNLLGFGRSARPDADYSIASQAEVLGQFFDSQNLAQADLGGWSMGGWVALKFALDHPERVRRIILVDSAGLTFKPPFDLALFRPANADQAQQLVALLTPQAARIPRFMARDLVRQMLPTRWVVQRALKSMLAGSDLLDGKLSNIREPVLIVWGKQDAMIPLASGDEMHRQMPQSQLAIFDGCGHMMPVECSGRLASEIRPFLDSEPPLPASVEEFPNRGGN